MKQFKKFTFAAISLLAAVAYAEDVTSDVKVLQKDTFDGFVNEHPLVLAECTYCFFPPFIWSLGSWH